MVGQEGLLSVVSCNGSIKDNAPIFFEILSKQEKIKERIFLDIGRGQQKLLSGNGIVILTAPTFF